ncbi:MAG TPA: hypothetical protein PLA68_07815 [Panacibacter sp.]|nr:hypothetical protein [Panacibacter sp.]
MHGDHDSPQANHEEDLFAEIKAALKNKSTSVRRNEEAMKV